MTSTAIPASSSLSSGPAPRLDRRGFLRKGGQAAVALTGLAGWSCLWEPHWLAIEEGFLQIPNLPQSLTGARLVHISDLHTGQVSSTYLRRALEQVNLLEPDFLVITGDWVDARWGMSHLEEVLEVLKPARIKTLGCLGNHDYGITYSQVELANAVHRCAQSYGIEVLRNEKVNVAGIQFIGLDDYWSPRFKVRSLMKSLDSSHPSICLCHNPDACDEPIWEGFRGVILSGHTHGGQCRPPFLPPPVIPVKNRSYTQGFFQLDPKRELFISRGLGHTYRIRFNCRPQIAVFELTEKKQA
jgi:predicted MPP superfamily phosphohydrolase